MGVQISDIVPRKEININDLKGKIIAVDALNTLYQFLTTIRQPDGTPLMDSSNKITSHLSGLFYRNLNLLQAGIKLVYVFDGKPPELKAEEIKKREANKEKARKQFETAKEREDTEAMRKYSQQFVKISQAMIDESKELLEAMGIPCIQAKGEGEEEPAWLVSASKAYAVASQDYDALLYGAPMLVRNLTLARKRKTPTGYKEINQELVEFQAVLNHLQINKDQLICLGILVGTDFNPGGVKGIGQKRALEIVRKYKYPYEIFKYVEKSEKYELDFDWQTIFEEFHNQQARNEDIEFKKINKQKIKDILLKREFSESRIDSGLEKLEKIEEDKKQVGLSEFLG
ncbi:MAG: flap endonuclease-1 [Candidatus Nanoarchaeia archaeon]